MKKSAIVLALGLLLTAAVGAGAAGGADNLLVSLSYLQDTFTRQVEQETDRKLDDSDRLALEGQGDREPIQAAAVWQETRLKQNDILQASTGTELMVLAGKVQVSYYGGAVIDVTTGQVVADGTVLTPDHRYLTAEDTSALLVVTSKTAVVNYQGPYDLQYSDSVDYNAMASALKTLHLFKGSFTGYGQGFDLEKAPTRLQALIMFIRVLGEEEEALAWSGTTPFKDLEKGSQAEKYVGYAYEKGYTNGYTATAFKPAGAVNAYQYTEFVLRALGYSSIANTNLADTLDRAQTAGVLTAGEAAMLQRDPFLRAELVYISYYALDAAMAETGVTLGQTLETKGVFTEREYREARELVTTNRIY